MLRLEGRGRMDFDQIYCIMMKSFIKTGHCLIEKSSPVAPARRHISKL